MINGSQKLLLLACLCMLSMTGLAAGPGMGGKNDVFKGKLFAPKVILQFQDELDLTKDQFTAIKTSVVEVQGNVAEHEWDLREAYLGVLDGLDESPIDEKRVLQGVQTALSAENEVKKLQVRMLIRIRNLLTDEQVEFLEQHAEK